MDQGSNKNHSPAYNFTPTVTKFCVMWEGLSLPHDTKFGNCRCKIVDSRSFHSWSLIHGLRWSGLIKAAPGSSHLDTSILINSLWERRSVKLQQPNELHFRIGIIGLNGFYFRRHRTSEKVYLIKLPSWPLAQWFEHGWTPMDTFCSCGCRFTNVKHSLKHSQATLEPLSNLFFITVTS